MLDIKVDDKAFRASLDRLYKGLGNLTPVMQGIGQALESKVSERFETRTDPNGKNWAPWASSTIEGYPFPGSPAGAGKEGAGNARLLDRYGKMLGGLSHQATATSVRVGFDEAYSAYHEFGSADMPRRGLLFANPDEGTLGAGDKVAVLDVLSKYLNDLNR